MPDALLVIDTPHKSYKKIIEELERKKIIQCATKEGRPIWGRYYLTKQALRDAYDIQKERKCQHKSTKGLVNDNLTKHGDIV